MRKLAEGVDALAYGDQGLTNFEHEENRMGWEDALN